MPIGTRGVPIAPHERATVQTVSCSDWSIYRPLALILLMLKESLTTNDTDVDASQRVFFSVVAIFCFFSSFAALCGAQGMSKKGVNNMHNSYFYATASLTSSSLYKRGDGLI